MSFFHEKSIIESVNGLHNGGEPIFEGCFYILIVQAYFILFLHLDYLEG